MPSPHGKKPPSPHTVSRQHGRKPPPPPAHSSSGQFGCAVLVFALAAAPPSIWILLEAVR
jgi:hypothetical protein